MLQLCCERGYTSAGKATQRVAGSLGLAPLQLFFVGKYRQVKLESVFWRLPIPAHDTLLTLDVTAAEAGLSGHCLRRKWVGNKPISARYTSVPSQTSHRWPAQTTVEHTGVA